MTLRLTSGSGSGLAGELWRVEDWWVGVGLLLGIGVTKRFGCRRRLSSVRHAIDALICLEATTCCWNCCVWRWGACRGVWAGGLVDPAPRGTTGRRRGRGVRGVLPGVLPGDAPARLPSQRRPDRFGAGRRPGGLHQPATPLGNASPAQRGAT